MLKDALEKQILESRALSYRKIALGLAVALIALLTLSQVQFDQMAFFGVHLAADHAGNRTLVLRAVAGLLGYHTLFFTYYAWIDFNNWLGDATAETESRVSAERPFFPEWQMYFGKGPRSRRWQQQSNGELTSDWVCEINRDIGQVTIRTTKAPQPPMNWYYYVLPYREARLFRIRFGWFFAFDIAMPILLTLVALVMWLRG